MMWIALALLTLFSLMYLLGGKAASQIARETEAKRLIAQYQDNQLGQNDPHMQQEADYRLYHELAALLKEKEKSPQQQRIGILYLLIAAVFALSIVIWYSNSGGEMQRWQRVYQASNHEIMQHKIFGKGFLSQTGKIAQINQLIEHTQFFPEDGRKHTPLLLYCQVLQRRLNRNDVIELEALGDCYSQLSLFELALPAYERLNLLKPNATEHILAWAQAKTLANPNQAPDAEVMQKLQFLLEKEPDNALAMLFLASAYQQHEEMEKAWVLWQKLLSQLSSDDPLYPAIKQAADKAASAQKKAIDRPQAAQAPIYHIAVSIDEQILANLPATAKLFVMIAPQGEKMPLVVKMLQPQAQQKLELSDADSMAGASLQDYPQLVIRALLSPSGTVGDGQAIKAEKSADSAQESIQLHLAP